MITPTSDEQIRFVVNLQRLLDEGLFVASYKFALLLALSDLSVEKGDDSGRPLTLTATEIAAKFVQYYWRQAVPYAAAARASVLQQNTGKQAAIVNILQKARTQHGDSLVALMNKPTAWKSLVREVARVVKVMPLWKLQTIGQEHLEFLYKRYRRLFLIRRGRIAGSQVGCGLGRAGGFRGRSSLCLRVRYGSSLFGPRFFLSLRSLKRPKLLPIGTGNWRSESGRVNLRISLNGRLKCLR